MSISGFLCAILFFKSSRDDVGLGRRKTQFAIDDFLKLQETGFSSKHTNNIQAPSSLIFFIENPIKHKKSACGHIIIMTKKRHLKLKLDLNEKNKRNVKRPAATSRH